MKSITVHGLDDTLDRRIRSEADERGQSLNKTMKQLLGKALGVSDEPHDRRQDFQDLFGSWSSEELETFTRSTEGFSRIDPGDWE